MASRFRPQDQRKEQEKLDQAVAKREHETPEQRARREAEFENEREKDREFLREVPDLFDFKLLGDEKIDGHDVWVISATPKPGAQPKRGDAKPLLKVQAKVWIDKAEYQWVRLEAETTATISFGLFIARLAPGAKLVFEQTRVNDEVWLPKREVVQRRGAAGPGEEAGGRGRDHLEQLPQVPGGFEGGRDAIGALNEFPRLGRYKASGVKRGLPIRRSALDSAIRVTFCNGAVRSRGTVVLHILLTLHRRDL